MIFFNEYKWYELENYFRNVYVLVKNNRLIRDIIWLIELDKVKNIDYGEIYLNWKLVIIFMEYILEVKMKVIDLEVVKNVKFYSFSMDGRIDEGCVE